MLAIAVLAGLFAVLGVAPAIVIVIGALSTPILLADPGRRIRTAAWVASVGRDLFGTRSIWLWFLH
jgi:hypothetical protein